MISRSSGTDHFLVLSMQTSMGRIACTGLSEPFRVIRHQANSSCPKFVSSSDSVFICDGVFSSFFWNHDNTVKAEDES